jgi:mono/diheme cytochrome c family protein
VAGGAPAASAQEASGADVYQGACASCHRPDGAGVSGAFPPLAGNPNATDPAYVEEVVRNGKSGPIEVNGETYDAVMPPVANLTDAEIAAVAAFVADLAAGGETPGTTLPPAAPAAGDPARGEDLFVGGAALTAGGPACVSCHATGPHGGASLGPDLTGVYSRLGGEAGLTGWLAAPPSPTMQPIFADHPLDPADVADLVAYLGSVDGTQPDRGPDVMLLGGLGGLVVLFGAMALGFRRPRGRYVDQIKDRTRSRV